MKRKDIIVTTVTLLLISILGSLIYNIRNQEKEKPRVSYKQDLVFVKSEKATPSTENIQFSNQGKVISSNNVDIVSEVSGTIINSEIQLKKGVNFRKGTVLYRIDQQNAVYQLKAAKGDLIRTVAAFLIDIKTDFPTESNKWQDFYNGIKLDEALPDLPEKISTQEKTFLASQGIYSQYYNIKNQQYMIGKSVITAPFDGTINQVFFREGSSVNPGNKLLNINQRNAIEIQVSVPNYLAPFIKTGSTVTLGDQEKGTINRKDIQVESSTQSITFYITTSSDLQEGAYVDVSFNEVKVENVFKFDQDVLFDGKSLFLINSDTTVSAKEVDIVHKSDNQVYFQGIEAGSKVVTYSSSILSDGQAVKLEKR